MTVLAHLIRYPGVLISTGAFIIRLPESSNTSEIINVLNTLV
ncbi:MAG: hypothetical protein ACE5I1_03250 [bacterium]